MHLLKGCLKVKLNFFFNCIDWRIYVSSYIIYRYYHIAFCKTSFCKEVSVLLKSIVVHNEYCWKWNNKSQSGNHLILKSNVVLRRLAHCGFSRFDFTEPPLSKPQWSDGSTIFHNKTTFDQKDMLLNGVSSGQWR